MKLRLRCRIPKTAPRAAFGRMNDYDLEIRSWLGPSGCCDSLLRPAPRASKRRHVGRHRSQDLGGFRFRASAKGMLWQYSCAMGQVATPASNDKPTRIGPRQIELPDASLFGGKFPHLQISPPSGVVRDPSPPAIHRPI